MTKPLTIEMSPYIFILQTISHLSLCASFRNIGPEHEHKPVTQTTLRQPEEHLFLFQDVNPVFNQRNRINYGFN